MAEEQRFDQSDIYHIRIKGNLDAKWADWFDGFVMASRDGGETLLTGPVADQAALQGVLGKIHYLGLPLLLAVQSDCPCSSKKCARHGKCEECAAHYSARGQLPNCLRKKSKWDKQCLALTNGK